MLASTFGRFVATLRYEDLPPPVVEALKLRLLDVLGAAVSGIDAGGYAAFALPPAPGRARIWASGQAAAPRDATFLNSFVSHATYMEDGSRFCGGHPASVVVPAALATLEDAGGNGTALLAAMAVGYEVFLRLGRAVYPEVVRRGFQSTAALGAVASAAASASARGLSPEQAGHAIAIAANLGFGLKHALHASGSQPVQVARACEGGILATHAASNGAQGAPDILENGLLKVLGGRSDTATALEGLGRDYRVGETYIKLHGGCRGNHAPIDLVRDLVRQSCHPVSTIQRIDIAVDSVTHAADIEVPQTADQAQFSAAYAVAVALLTGDALPERYCLAQLRDAAQRALMAKIHVSADPTLDAHYPGKRGAVARITFADGASVEGRMDNARGEPEVPVTRAEVEEKYFRLAKARLGPRAETVRALIMSMETCTDLSGLTSLLADAAQSDGVAKWRKGA